ncbi:Golgi transport complex subunit 3, partial [Exophiala xenobiotica]
YLDDMRTRETLVAAVEDQVVQIYEAFFDAYVNRFGGGGGGGGKMNGGSQISRKGKGPENAVWDFDTFAEWADSMFNVALPNVDDDGMSHPASRSLSRSGST